MDALELYDDHARERLVPEPPKRVDAPVRTPFERDRARVVHAASSRRLAAKTQVVGPQSDDFVRNRLTHSLEVAQVARDLSRALGSHPDIAETAALAHDLGHPPFGHNGERVLADLAVECGGFEGNAQTLRLLTRLESKTFDQQGRSVGLNLTRATLDACSKYPWGAEELRDGKFGVYADDRLMTNAHVVAGVDAPQVQVGDQTVQGEVVYYNPDVDVAVIEVDTGTAPVLEFADAAPQDAVVIAGYPEDGPYDLRAGRIRAEQRLRSPNIYGNGTVIREVYSLRGLVRPGNSGGPIVNPRGDVVGVVFAASVTDADTGYALTTDQVAQAAAQGRAGTQPVSTGGCAS